MEIGAFVGGSIRQWLSASPDSTIMAIDPWPQIHGPNFFCDTHPVGRENARQLREHDGLYSTFLATLWDDRERVIPLRGTGCDMLPILQGSQSRHQHLADRRHTLDHRRTLVVVARIKNGVGPAQDCPEARAAGSRQRRQSHVQLRVPGFTSGIPLQKRPSQGTVIARR